MKGKTSSISVELKCILPRFFVCLGFVNVMSSEVSSFRMDAPIISCNYRRERIPVNAINDREGYLQDTALFVELSQSVPFIDTKVNDEGFGNLPTDFPEGCEIDEILSRDPLVYTVKNLITSKECSEYIERAANSSELVRSNAPAAGVDMKRLWPLPILILFSTIPSMLRLLSSNTDLTVSNIIDTVKLPLFIGSFSTVILVAVANELAKNVATSSRTSSSVSFNRKEDFDFIRPFMKRTYEVTGHKWYNFEAPVITRYRAGESFGMHNDASPSKGSEWSENGGQRVITIITYLNDVPDGAGGGTRFDRLNTSRVEVKPRVGKSLIFYPADFETLEMDDRTRHESVIMNDDFEGEKWIVQLFGRKNRVPHPLGIANEFSTSEKK